MSDTTYEPGIYRDVDGDVIKVDTTGKPSIIGVGHDGFPIVDMNFASKIADLPRSERPTPTIVEPASSLEDGVYKDDDGDVVLIYDGKVIEVLETGDSCSEAEHLDYFTSSRADLSNLVRLVAPDADSDEPLPADGVYADRDGDLVQVKGDKMRYLSEIGTYAGAYAGWEDLAETFRIYGPYTPLVEAAAK